MLLVTGCGTDAAPAGEGRPYRSLWAELYPGSLESLEAESPRGTLQGDFRRAAGADTEAAADSLWRAFLTEWDAGADGFEDAMQARFVGWARLEVERLRHLEAADSAGVRAVEDSLRALAAGSG